MSLSTGQEDKIDMEPVRVGVVGCGNISPIYFKAGKTFEILDIRACSDLIPERSRSRAEEFGVPRVCTTEEIMADPSIEIVLNITQPVNHASVALQAVQAGKSVYNEKPLTIEREQAQAVLRIARERGLLVGGAPDTFLGAGLQTCRKLIDDGWIGEPIGATAFMLCHGHESWHPDPEFYYEVGGGPMFDMGPYYITALVSLLGPVRRVCGSARITFKERTITSQPKYGKRINVEVPTHVAGTLDFESGAIGTIITSFDVWSSQLPRIEIYGTRGSLSCPDPNTFGGPVRIRLANDQEWREVSLTHSYAENSRGLGLADMAYALRTGRRHRANESLTYHVLDVMHAIHEASDTGQYVTLKSTCERPEPFPMGLMHGRVDE